MDDLKILELYNTRSELAIAYTSEKYGNYAKHIAFNVLGNHSDAEECVSDAYMKLWETIPPNEPKSLKAFLGKIVKNKALDRFRKENSEKRGGGQMLLCLSELEDCVPAHEIETEEVTEVINSFLRKQDAKKSKIFIRRYWYQDSIREIAISMGMTDGNVKTTLSRMRKELKDELEKEGINI